ncbi:MAG: DUF3617 family protein [Sphingomonas sp.]|jgi:outer membrane murein-binding lipoprotein Lpp|nr:DUF3617 family protein [Sphingomonas sp.]
MIAAAAAALLSGCSDDAPVKQEETTASKLTAGQYQASWKVNQVRSVDKTTPATKLKQDAAGTSTACIAADGTIDPALFAEDGDSCKTDNAYVRNGRMSMDLTCRRKGQGGEVRQSVSGTFTADSLDTEVSTTTYLSGSGDYAMSRAITAKRVGECAPAAPAEKKA